MKLIVQAYDYGRIGGIASYLNGFLHNLPKNVELVLITADNSGIEKIKPKNIKIIKIPFKINFFGKIAWGKKCRKEVAKLQKSGFDKCIIHIPPLLPNLFQQKGVEYILTAHSTYKGQSEELYKKKHTKSNMSTIEKNIRIFLEKKLFRKAKRIITLTKQGEFELEHYGVKKEKISIIPNGVDSNNFKTKKLTKKYDILFAGRLTIKKGSKALVKLCEELKDKKIVIVGEGEEYKNVKKSLEKYSNIEILGKVKYEEISKYYDISKIYVSTSYHEGLPGTCMEAMSMNLPVVVWDFQFYDSLITNGKEGYKINPNDFEEMKNKIDFLLKNKKSRTEMGNAGRKKVIKNFNWKTISNNICKAVEK